MGKRDGNTKPEEAKAIRVFIGRQAIFDGLGRVAAWELLFRDGFRNAFNPDMDGDRATAELLDRVCRVFGLSALTGGNPAFINFTRPLLLSGVLYQLNPSEFVAEILEGTEIDGDLLQTLSKYREAGYRFALDDYAGEDFWKPALAYANFVKVDFQKVKGSRRGRLAEKLRRAGVTPLAEKVETKRDYRQAAEAGYELFQGYYLRRPDVLYQDMDSLGIACAL